MTSASNNGKQPTLAELALSSVEDSKRWFPKTALSINHSSLALAGEVGEFCNIVKKIDRGSLDPNDSAVRYDMAMELTDIFVYLLNLAGLLRIDLNESYKVVQAANEKRFTDPKAPHRQGQTLQSPLRAVRDNPQA